MIIVLTYGQRLYIHKLVNLAQKLPGDDQHLTNPPCRRTLLVETTKVAVAAEAAVDSEVAVGSKMAAAAAP